MIQDRVYRCICHYLLNNHFLNPNKFASSFSDSTYQYIKGSADIKSNQGIFPSGLQCVTILIGVYDLHTGVPLMGVINQPFVSQDLNTLR